MIFRWISVVPPVPLVRVGVPDRGESFLGGVELADDHVHDVGL
jgi:hypothetical protein